MTDIKPGDMIRVKSPEMRLLFGTFGKVVMVIHSPLAPPGGLTVDMMDHLAPVLFYRNEVELVEREEVK